MHYYDDVSEMTMRHKSVLSRYGYSCYNY